ncbi:MAG TPA: alpha/beta fold hydrolase [Actinomycetota bacterium]
MEGSKSSQKRGSSGTGLRGQVRRWKYRAQPDAGGYTVEHQHFWCETEDGVRIAGSRLGSNPDVALVLVHGFMAYRLKSKWRLLAQALAGHFTVFALDLRGHGGSGGACTGGNSEPMDVRAVISLARASGFTRVVTVGASLGGIAVLFEAARYRDPDAVVAISSPAGWVEHESKAVRRMTWVFTSSVGRALARRLMGTTIHTEWGNPEPPADVVGRIAPVPLLLIHGADDHFFPPADAELLLERAGEPKRLVILEPFGHAEDGFTPTFARRLVTEIQDMLAAVEA